MPTSRPKPRSARSSRRAFREDGFYGEESAATRMDAEHVWIVDPIDGTKSFVRRYPMFSTQIAVMRRGRIELGVSSAPVYRRDRLGRARRRRAPRRRAARRQPHRGARAGDAFHRESPLARAAGRAGRRSGDSSRASTASAASAISCTTTCSRPARSTPCSSPTSTSRTSRRSSVIVEEAGGRVTDLEGAPIGLGTRSILATNGALHDPILEALNG